MPTCPDRQALSGVLVYDSQQPHSPAVLGPDQNEVVGPYVVRPLGSEPDARPVIEPKSCSPGLLPGTFSPSRRQILSSLLWFTLQPRCRSRAVILR